jgi:putative transposase
VHRARDTLAKVSVHDQAEVKADLLGGLRRRRGRTRRCGGRRRPGPGRRIHRQVAGPLPRSGRLRHRRPGSLTVHLRFPAEHWRRIRHSNFIERTFGETRRRTKVIGRLPGERSCLSLVWAVLDRASHGWRGLTMTPKGLRLLQDLRRQLLHPPIPEEVIDQAVTTAA